MALWDKTSILANDKTRDIYLAITRAFDETRKQIEDSIKSEKISNAKTDRIFELNQTLKEMDKTYGILRLRMGRALAKIGVDQKAGHWTLPAESRRILNPTNWYCRRAEKT